MEELQLQQYKIQYHQFSTTGKRKSNQDKVSVVKINDQSALFLVADGMGGYSFGDIAAELVINEVNQKITYEIGVNSTEVVINDAISNANSLVNKLVLEKEAESGATLGGILIKDLSYSIFWVGDVKILLLRNAELNFMSKSHTLENELRMNKSWEYVNSSLRHIVTRSLSGKDKLYNPELKEIEIQEGDKLIIASDGFYELFNEMEIIRLMKSKINWDQFIHDVLPLRLKKANDNASGILIDILEPQLAKRLA
ncbi:MAG: serine/threonine-protein phosphatase [Pyrinomonadaceae bacterium]|nr:serine/threonine-protein phosphatase [Sphingobacteriaceae bacterium]